MLFLYLLLRRRLYNFKDFILFKDTTKIIIATLAMALATYGCLHLFSAVLELDHTITVFLQGAFAGGVGILVFIGAAMLLKIEQTSYALGIVKRKIFG
jgi:peptidoglycan biosynthesis protein MviN/MurJ (putative lipid II flippase)